MLVVIWISLQYLLIRCKGTIISRTGKIISDKSLEISSFVSFFHFFIFHFLAAAGGGKGVYNNIIIIAIPDAGVAGGIGDK